MMVHTVIIHNQTQTMLFESIMSLIFYAFILLLLLNFVRFGISQQLSKIEQ